MGWESRTSHCCCFPLGNLAALAIGARLSLSHQSSLPGLRHTSSYFTVRHSRSTKMLSAYRPFPSMLILTSWSRNVPEHLGELPAGGQAATVGVEYLGPAPAQRVLQRLDAAVRLQGVGQPPGHQVEEPSGHGEIGDVRRPYLVRLSHFDIFQQVGIDPMTGAGRLVRGRR